MEDVGFLKNGKTTAIVTLTAINKNKSAIGMSKTVFKKEGS